MQDIKQQLLEEFSEYETNFEKGILYTIGKHKHTILDYVGKLLNLAVEQEKERLTEAVSNLETINGSTTDGFKKVVLHLINNK